MTNRKILTAKRAPLNQGAVLDLTERHRIVVPPTSVPWIELPGAEPFFATGSAELIAEGRAKLVEALGAAGSAAPAGSRLLIAGHGTLPLAAERAESVAKAVTEALGELPLEGPGKLGVGSIWNGGEARLRGYAPKRPERVDVFLFPPGAPPLFAEEKRSGEAIYAEPNYLCEPVEIEVPPPPPPPPPPIDSRFAMLQCEHGRLPYPISPALLQVVPHAGSGPILDPVHDDLFLMGGEEITWRVAPEDVSPVGGRTGMARFQAKAPDSSSAKTPFDLFEIEPNGYMINADAPLEENSRLAVTVLAYPGEQLGFNFTKDLQGFHDLVQPFVERWNGFMKLFTNHDPNIPSSGFELKVLEDPKFEASFGWAEWIDGRAYEAWDIELSAKPLFGGHADVDIDLGAVLTKGLPEFEGWLGLSWGAALQSYVDAVTKFISEKLGVDLLDKADLSGVIKSFLKDLKALSGGLSWGMEGSPNIKLKRSSPDEPRGLTRKEVLNAENADGTPKHMSVFKFQTTAMGQLDPTAEMLSQMSFSNPMLEDIDLVVEVKGEAELHIGAYFDFDTKKLGLIARARNAVFSWTLVKFKIEGDFLPGDWWPSWAQEKATIKVDINDEETLEFLYQNTPDFVHKGKKGGLAMVFDIDIETSDDWEIDFS